jgi:cell division protein ZapA (FtsZ GTPase activity inhibitor)
MSCAWILYGKSQNSMLRMAARHLSENMRCVGSATASADLVKQLVLGAQAKT